ncbi:MAG: hypothetical protein ACOCYX_06835 [Spirochaetota bacterium]
MPTSRGRDRGYGPGERVRGCLPDEIRRVRCACVLVVAQASGPGLQIDLSGNEVHVTVPVYVTERGVRKGPVRLEST